jgi:hypothetical protein
MSDLEIAEITPSKGPNPQKVKWSNVAYYDNFQQADEHRNSLSGLTKVRRCGQFGTKFVVKAGTEISKGEQK